MSMLEMEYYRPREVRPSWQQIERYDYCTPMDTRHDGYLERLRAKLKKLVKA